jgi:glycosyltransferase involved in cell wall biosynthesis
VIDIHEEPCSLATAEVLLLRRLLRLTTPVILYSAQNIYKRYPPPFSLLERWALRTSSGVYVCNLAASRILRRKGFRGAVAVLPLGVDVHRFAPHHNSGPSERPGLRIGYVGRLESHKGVEVIIEAIAGESGWDLEIVGDGQHAAELTRRVEASDLSSRVRFRRHVPHGDLPALYRSFDVVVIPSLPTARWEEQFCRVAVEAMASGVPVVASSSGALPEVVGDSGLFFPPGDAEVLRSVLRCLERDAPQRATLAANGRARAKRFSWDEVALGHRALYDAVAL